MLEALPQEVRNLVSQRAAELSSSVKAGGMSALVDMEKKSAEIFNRSARGNLTGYDCPECLNRGYFDVVDDNGHKFSKPCKCMEIRRSLRNIEKSGLKDLLESRTFDTWEATYDWQRNAASKACGYVRERSGWFYIGGTVGAGKTHLCTAICGSLLKRGYPVRYVLWRDFSTQAKALVNDDVAYQRMVEPLKRVKVLYIDDLLKTKKGAEPTPGDVNLLFEIINARYNDKNLLTIISTELSIDRLMEIDPAVGSRIYERSKKNCIQLEGVQNHRMEGYQANES